MRVFFLSDLHIADNEDPTFLRLLRVLNELPKPGDICVLGGDIFDVYVGEKRIFSEMYDEFFKVLERSEKAGVSFHYIEGNHDFHLGKIFRRKGLGVAVSPRDVIVEGGGMKIYVAHGDLADQEDISYRALRAFYRSPVARILVAAIPGKALLNLGRSLSSWSRDQRPRLPDSWPRVQREALRKIYRSFAAEKIKEGFDGVVLGHCHDQDEQAFRVGDHEGRYFNLGFPPVHGELLVLDTDLRNWEKLRF